MVSVAITRDDLDSAGLREAASGTRDARQARRLLALAMVLDGHPRQLAAQAGGMDRQTLRDWVCRYNAHGREGLRDVARSDRPPALSAEQIQELEQLVLTGPDLKADGVVRWRCVDLRAQIKTRFKVELHERTVGKPDEALASSLLRRLRMTRLQPRPYHPKQDVAAQEAYKKLCKPCSGRPDIRGGWQDDRGVVPGRGPRRPARHSVLRVGADRLAPSPGGDCRHESAYLFGAICPARAVGAAIVMLWVSSEAMTLHLAEISKQVSASAHALLVCDGAGWHQPGVRLTVPDNITLLRLPPYAPELNPIENVWEYLRGNALSMTVWESYTAIVDACCDAWNSLMRDAERIASLTTRDWA